MIAALLALSLAQAHNASAASAQTMRVPIHVPAHVSTAHASTGHAHGHAGARAGYGYGRTGEEAAIDPDATERDYFGDPISKKPPGPFTTFETDAQLDASSDEQPAQPTVGAVPPKSDAVVVETGDVRDLELAPSEQPEGWTHPKVLLLTPAPGN